MGNSQGQKKEENVISSRRSVRPGPLFVISYVKLFLLLFCVFLSYYVMSDIELSDSDESYRPEDDGDVLESEEYFTLENDIIESEDESLVSLGGGWSRVDVYQEERHYPLPPLRKNYSGVNPTLGIDKESSVIFVFASGNM